MVGGRLAQDKRLQGPQRTSLVRGPFPSAATVQAGVALERSAAARADHAGVDEQQQGSGRVRLQVSAGNPPLRF